MRIEEYLEQPSLPRSNEGAQSDWLDIGVLEINSGTLAVGDCVLLPSDQIELSVVPGTYSVQARILDFGHDRRTSHLRAWIPDSVFERQSAGGFSVDFAVAGVYDKSGFMAVFEPYMLDTDKWAKEYGAKLEAEFGVIDLSGGNEPSAKMIFVATGWGDGYYEVIKLVSQAGVTGLEVNFIEPDEQYLFEGKQVFDIISGKAHS